MTNNKMNQKNLPWFPFYTAAWLGSDKVENMTMTERGIYVTLMAMCWQYGSITWEKKSLAKRMGVDARTLGTFMDKYVDLTQMFHEGSMEVTLPKMQEFAMTLGKNKGGSGTDEKRGDNKHYTNKKPGASDASASVSKNKSNDNNNDLPCPTQNDSLSHPPVPPVLFDPLSFAEPVGSFNGAEVQRVLLYHFKFHPSPYWTDPAKGDITSLARLAKALPSMAEQVPSDWKLPAPKPEQTRTVGDPSCRRCRGRGRISVEASNGDRHSVECDSCEPRQQIARGMEWVGVK